MFRTEFWQLAKRWSLEVQSDGMPLPSSDQSPSRVGRTHLSRVIQKPAANTTDFRHTDDRVTFVGCSRHALDGDDLHILNPDKIQ